MPPGTVLWRTPHAMPAARRSEFGAKAATTFRGTVLQSEAQNITFRATFANTTPTAILATLWSRSNDGPATECLSGKVLR
jgi:hypothetical protein